MTLTGRPARIGLMAVAAVAVAWLATGFRAAVLQDRGNDVAGGLSRGVEVRQVDRAGRYFQRARRFNPDTLPLLLEAGVDRFVRARNRRGLELVREVLRREPDNVQAWAQLASFLDETDPAGAARARARVRELNPFAPGPPG